MRNFYLFKFIACLFISSVMILSCNVEKGVGSNELKAGVRAIDITPPVGYLVHGVPSEGVLDPVKVKTLVFSQGKKIAALVMADLFYIDLDFSNTIRKLASEETGIPFSNICVAATHTHADPTYIHDWEKYFQKVASGTMSKEDEDSYIGQLIRKMVRSVAEAKSNLKPITIQSVIAQTEGLVFNRRHLMKDGSVKMNGGLLNPDIVRAVGPVDPDMDIILINGKDDNKPFASFTTFAMQVATIGDTKKFSEGYPYFLETGLQQKFGKDFISVFGEGACADVNHWDITKPGPQIGYEECTKPIGEALAAAFLQKLTDLKNTGEALAIRSKVVHIPLQTYSSMDLEWARNYKSDPPNFLVNMRVKRILSLEKLRNRFGDTIPMEVQVFRLDAETAIVALSGQIFVELGLAIKKASPFSRTLIVTLANSHEECIPLRKAYTEGSYEIIYSRVEAGGGEMLVNSALSLLNGLKKNK